MIHFNNITKTYPGATKPSVDNLTMSVPEGETCVVIGPSGCGKTTTMKMVNRLIEPTEGEIYVTGRNILKQDPVELRRNIGYVIQQIGLFPHFTIRDNIAVVPKMLGWKKSRIDRRVDELLEIVGLEPTHFRNSYPRKLSGGQRQRVGVARALAADPPVMLMDEPFGAIDPITRDRLQNEFLRLQKPMKKTIMFVTHDIDEAIKMGTLVCILQVGGVLQQLDTPSNILSSPANSFVADFVGSDRGLKKLTLVRVNEVMKTDFPVGRHDESTNEILRRMKESDLDSLFITDEIGKLAGYVTLEAIQGQPQKKMSQMLQGIIATTEAEATMKDAFSQMLSYGIRYLPVVDERSKLVGMVTSDDAQRLVEQTNKVLMST
ncbi:putative transporter subunit: ATP-binding component of ABC superfamily transporter [Hyella patelloides LEGE 07179]|uniref:ABC-type quaternary amine transporter n=1 Tax=Hyella patelloides LEGE 07179 TaxID=945734 RepID=A0A563VPH4_9CYAN|nr:ABC transporter ATP-binding protein [Hyella patelloides]VEP13310.1 putative transporter subunit: ATP-binding component of ABC superfamily transporter [Hyella patelloides LEGE 07179]